MCWRKRRIELDFVKKSGSDICPNDPQLSQHAVRLSCEHPVFDFGTGSMPAAMHYSRILDQPFMDMLLPNGPFHFLVRDFRNWVADDSFALDIHLRKRNVLTYYHGTTRLLCVSYDSKRSSISFTAANAYSTVTGYASLMKRRSIDDHMILASLVPEYLRAAVAVSDPRYYRNQLEGHWQNRLGIRWGVDWTPSDDWLIVDREAVIGFRSGAARQAVQRPIQEKYLLVRQKLQQEDSRKWGRRGNKTFGNELDFLAIDREGELLGIELKHGGHAAGVYWGRLQAAVYRDIWQQALSEISSDVLSLVRQKIQLGLLPISAKDRLPLNGFRIFQGAVLIAEPNDLSDCWKRASEVSDRCPDANVPMYEISRSTGFTPRLRNDCAP